MRARVLSRLYFRRDVRLAPAASLTRRKFLRSACGGVQAAKISVRPAQTQPRHPRWQAKEH
ncbi:MAG: hypothetical protein A2Y00_00205 [Omnitrophica WOR_2 bacterium GWF2_43_52]|nr:MAG: hypothetical protein A2Y00_00205 [Omnitrophica WOR_2 bacterium GWF2_43_52]OGX57055.1 MAG: hypothetical protein A2460_08920 [Omnitrophica WOR_2 bacterium RIFOXYC2_FULL_43_9]HBG63335.1 hypothetical protein [Candidatus Omnitrophota bacterium]